MSVMARYLFICLLVTAPWSLAHATPTGAAGLAANEVANPYNDTLRRINPNTRQGTEPLTPQAPADRQRLNPRPPTLQNGGIGNGQNLRPAPLPPRIEPVHPPRPTTP